MRIGPLFVTGFFAHLTQDVWKKSASTVICGVTTV